jgi:hypothetical protein
MEVEMSSTRTSTTAPDIGLDADLPAPRGARN